MRTAPTNSTHQQTQHRHPISQLPSPTADNFTHQHDSHRNRLATNLQTAQRDDHGSVRIESHICLLRRSTASPNNTSRSNNKEDLATYPQTAQRDDQRLRENRVSHLPSPTAANFTNRSRIKDDLATNLQTANHCMEPHQQTRHRHTHFIRQR
jgi:hypothetical protein